VSSTPIIVTLVALLAIAAYSDVRTYRIPNVVTVPGMLLGIALNGTLVHGAGFTSSMYGCLFALAGLMPLYVLRVWGAGDVKLMAMVGAFVGSGSLFGALLGSLLAGGITAVVVAWHRKRGRLLIDNLRCMLLEAAFNAQVRGVTAIDTPAESAGKVAYALPILLGTVGYLIYDAHV
jgi:prepilin peptidase CpaA